MTEPRITPAQRDPADQNIAVEVEVKVPDAVFPAGSLRVVAGAYFQPPLTTAVLSEVHEPLHAPVTVKTMVLLPFVMARVPVKVTVYTVPFGGAAR